MKTFLITGTSQGIGNFIAKQLLKDGHRVIGISRKKTKIKDKKFIQIIFDLKKKNFDELTRKIFKISNRIDYFINNAGISYYNSNKSIKKIYETFDVNFFAGLKISLFLLKKNSKTNLVHISSISGLRAMPNNISYNASKAAVIMMSKSLARDYAKSGAISNTIVLGYFNTNMTRKTFMNKLEIKRKKNMTMTGKLGGVKDIYKTIKFLTTENLTNLNGQEVILDGGWTAKGI